MIIICIKIQFIDSNPSKEAFLNDYLDTWNLISFYTFHLLKSKLTIVSFYDYKMLIYFHYFHYLNSNVQLLFFSERLRINSKLFLEFFEAATTRV